VASEHGDGDINEDDQLIDRIEVRVLYRASDDAIQS
jgi:hypothetical protein